MIAKEQFRQAESHRRRPCAVVLILEKVTPEEREAIEEALDDPAIGHASIAEVLRANGHEIKGDTVSRHRRGMCCVGYRELKV